MIYENKQDLYAAYKRIKNAYLNSSDCTIRLSSSILETNAKKYRFEPENTRKNIHKVTRKCNGSEYIYCFQGLAPAILFMIKRQFEPAYLETLKPHIVKNPVKIPCNLFSKK